MIPCAPSFTLELNLSTVDSTTDFVIMPERDANLAGATEEARPVAYGAGSVVLNSSISILPSLFKSNKAKAFLIF